MGLAFERLVTSSGACSHGHIGLLPEYLATLAYGVSRAQYSRQAPWLQHDRWPASPTAEKDGGLHGHTTRPVGRRGPSWAHTDGLYTSGLAVKVCLTRPKRSDNLRCRVPLCHLPSPLKEWGGLLHPNPSSPTRPAPVSCCDLSCHDVCTLLMAWVERGWCWRCSLPGTSVDELEELSLMQKRTCAHPDAMLAAGHLCG